MIRREGERSYCIEIAHGKTMQAHMDHLKVCHGMPESPMLYPLEYRHEKWLSGMFAETPVEIVKDHRIHPQGWMEFLVQRGGDASDLRWEPIQKFLGACDEKWVQYVVDHGLEIPFVESMGDVEGWTMALSGEGS